MQYLKILIDEDSNMSSDECNIEVVLKNKPINFEQLLPNEGLMDEYRLDNDFESAGKRLIYAEINGKRIENPSYVDFLEFLIKNIPEENFVNLCNVNSHYRSVKNLQVSTDVTELSLSSQGRYIFKDGYYIGTNLSSKNILTLCKWIVIETGMNLQAIRIFLSK